MHSCTILTLLLTIAAPATIATTQDTAQITLVNAGSNHHEPLHHHFETGQTQAMHLRMQSQIRTLLGKQEQTIPIPIIRMDMNFRPTTITDSGNLRYAYEITDVGVTNDENKQLNQHMLTSITQLIGTHDETKINDHGNIVDFTYELPKDAPEGLQQQEHLLHNSISQILPHFPTKPIDEDAS